MKIRGIILATLACFVLFCSSALMAANDRGLKVSSDKRRVQRADGADWFWMGDTAWELFVLLSREEVDRYMANRRVKGYVWAFTDPTKKRYTWTMPCNANNRYWHKEMDTSARLIWNMLPI